MEAFAQNDAVRFFPCREKAAYYARKNFFLDFGLFIAVYFFALVLLSTLLLALGVVIGPYHCYIAIPFAYALFALIKRAPLYALLITLAGLVAIAACAYLVAGIYDMYWDSNCYHKADVGLLANGWNPFRVSFIEYANASAVLPHDMNWRPQQVDTQPKASFIIGACFYQTTGRIEAGKCFNLLGMLACVCYGAPLLRRTLPVKGFTAFLCVLFTAVNPITLVQCLSYYNDGFMFVLLSMCLLTFGYLLINPDGEFKRTCLAAGAILIALAVNVKTSALIYCAIVALGYYFFRINAASRWPDRAAFGRYVKDMTLYFAACVFCAVAVLGATTYIVNWYRYGSPIYGMLGESSINWMIEAEMSPWALSLPYAIQFLIVLFSPSVNVTFQTLNLKPPFTITPAEMGAAGAIDTRMAGWGVFFSGIFLVSLLIVLVAIVRLYRRRDLYYAVLLLFLAVFLLPIFFVPFLWWARYYPQPFWLVSLALCCLRMPRAPKRPPLKLHGVSITRVGAAAYGAKKPAGFLSALLMLSLCVLLLLNMAPQTRTLREQLETSDAYVRDTARLVALKSLYSMDISLLNNEFEGLLFNLQDAGIFDYTQIRALEETDGDLYVYMHYDLKWRDQTSPATLAAYLESLRSEDAIVVIACNGDATLSLSPQVENGMRALGLEFSRTGKLGESYIALIDGGRAVYEAQSPEAISYAGTVDGVRIYAHSSGGLSEPENAQLILNDVDYALDRRGYNIVVYSRSAGAVVDVARIDSYLDNAIYR